ncbi:cupin domain-containing protein [Natrinema halophilum]|uniref:Cupin domain-containing protein n=1 Tax=Natrinema halophilum TaxID=1699371 RepID=A0A7D5GIM1_9EURY|nr:cupin domain-containing protein [Natrinema halophilum]QLG49807.1 cupin domain-containing protein [Natrinema halophilum]
MDYSVVDPDDLEYVADRPCDLRRLSEAAGMDRVAINRFDADPGEQRPLAYHYHETQEEAFVVCSGTLHVETPDGEFGVAAGSMFTAPPEAPHRAYNPADADEPASVVAIGAPPVDGDAVPDETDE